MAYSLIDFESERFNGLLTMQYAPNDKITATLDILKATYEIEARSNDVSIWFNHGTVASVWGDGNPKPIISYNETFDPAGPSDFSMGAALTANENILDSVGLNLEVQATENLSLVFDYNRSESESKPIVNTDLIMSLVQLHTNLLAKVLIFQVTCQSCLSQV